MTDKEVERLAEARKHGYELGISDAIDILLNHVESSKPTARSALIGILRVLRQKLKRTVET